MENSNATSIVDHYLYITITYSGFFIIPHVIHFPYFHKHDLVNIQLKLHKLHPDTDIHTNS